MVDRPFPRIRKAQ